MKKLTKEDFKNFKKKRPLFFKLGIPMISAGAVFLGVALGTGISSIISKNDLTDQHAAYKENPTDAEYQDLETLRKQNVGTAIASYVMIPLSVACVTGGIVGFVLTKDMIDKAKEKAKNKPEKIKKPVKKKKKEKVSFLNIGMSGSNVYFDLGFKF